MLGKAGAAIVVCAMPKKAFQEKAEFAVLDAYLRQPENILLAIEALGLGGVLDRGLIRMRPDGSCA